MAVRRLLSTTRRASTRRGQPLPQVAGDADLLRRRHHGRRRLALIAALAGALVAGVW
ncbi:hypothetical protein [Virgisporangium aurantiacum]|uniref:hypothetical protein n=1 Tax=Virgisporangium aurantiacum TaxID=175570 RepID=UPI0019529D38|nr:hypothetical protein [Virgisporangium aurantiacum]